MRSLRAHVSAWPLAAVFTISRGSKTQADVIVAEIEQEGRVGRGECVPYARYGETLDSVMAQIQTARAWIDEPDIEALLAERLAPGAARNAIDCALWDLRAKRSGKRAWELAGLSAPGPVTTAYTLSLDSAEQMGRSARAHASRPLLKLKLDRESVVERVGAVRANAPRARLIVDANESWRVEDLDAWLPALAGLGVEMVEQPLPAGHDEALEGRSDPMPIGADESCHVSEDLEMLSARYQMVNIKLDKTGGLTEALRLRRDALAHGMEYMVGCMVGTSLSMAPATLLTGDARFVDLDGPLLLAHDRDPGLRYDGGQVFAPGPELWG